MLRLKREGKSYTKVTRSLHAFIFVLIALYSEGFVNQQLLGESEGLAEIFSDSSGVVMHFSDAQYKNNNL